MHHPLVCHPDTPAAAITGVGVTLAPGRLDYAVAGAGALRVPPHARPRRTDGLWKTSCFEMFVKPLGGEAYLEFNFSPSTQWAAYAFDGYRGGMRDLPLSAIPLIARAGDSWTVTLPPLEALRRGCTIALSAVIEEVDGTISYWALRHPPGKPDFHHPDCFALELPAGD